MGVIDEDKIQNILPKYNGLKLSGINLAQQYVSAFNTGMNIYQCINQLQGYIEWIVQAVNDVVIQWNENIAKNLENTMQYVKDQLPDLVDERIEIAINQLQDKYNTTLEKLDKEQKEQATKISNINSQLVSINTEINSLKELCNTMQSSIQNNLTQINNIKEDITTVKDDIINIKKGATQVASEGGI
jgi:DNA repair exonuclease SbcCD ATPase subunit